MGDRQMSWRETVRALGEALVEVFRAEVTVVAEAWKRSGKELGKALGLAVVALYLALICLPTLLLAALVSGLMEGFGWPLWGAALTVAGGVVLVLAVLGGIAAYIVKNRFESPVATVRHQVADHRAWWSERVLGDGSSGAPSEGEEADEDLEAGG